MIRPTVKSRLARALDKMPRVKPPATLFVVPPSGNLHISSEQAAVRAFLTNENLKRRTWR